MWCAIENHAPCTCIHRLESMSVIMAKFESFATTDDVQSILTKSAATDVGRAIELEGVCEQLNRRIREVELSLQQQAGQQTRPKDPPKPRSIHTHDSLSVRRLFASSSLHGCDPL